MFEKTYLHVMPLTAFGHPSDNNMASRLQQVEL